jgi:hypothetical protein
LLQVALDHLAQEIAGFREFFFGGDGHLETILWCGYNVPRKPSLIGCRGRVTSRNGFDRTEGSRQGS